MKVERNIEVTTTMEFESHKMTVKEKDDPAQDVITIRKGNNSERMIQLTGAQFLEMVLAYNEQTHAEDRANEYEGEVSEIGSRTSGAEAAA